MYTLLSSISSITETENPEEDGRADEVQNSQLNKSHIPLGLPVLNVDNAARSYDDNGHPTQYTNDACFYRGEEQKINRVVCLDGPQTRGGIELSHSNRAQLEEGRDSDKSDHPQRNYHPEIKSIHLTEFWHPTLPQAPSPDDETIGTREYEMHRTSIPAELLDDNVKNDTASDIAIIEESVNSGEGESGEWTDEINREKRRRIEIGSCQEESEEEKGKEQKRIETETEEGGQKISSIQDISNKKNLCLVDEIQPSTPNPEIIIPPTSPIPPRWEDVFAEYYQTQI